jgi:hypothetical protein
MEEKDPTHNETDEVTELDDNNLEGVSGGLEDADASSSSEINVNCHGC